jgi:Uncharacterised nucleotidyltransferase
MSATPGSTDSELLAAIRNPSAAALWTPEQWSRLVSHAYQTRLLARICCLLDDCDLLRQIPVAARHRLEWARQFARAQDRDLRWEVRQLERALSSLDVPVILLKGAAYVLRDLPPASGRLYADVDILVPKDKLTDVERALLAHGWEHEKLDPYDQRYYRDWMHELPPLTHRDRRTALDVHHTILPETGRLHPNAAELFRAALPLPGTRLATLCPADMVLHASAHLFEDGAVAGMLRDLVDLDALLRHFSQDPSFWPALFGRARLHQLDRPLFYALRYCSGFLGTPIDGQESGVRNLAAAFAAEASPGRPTLGLMDSLIGKALLPEDRDRPSFAVSMSAFLLYIRSHWLRMPAHLLLPHLTRKFFRRFIPQRPPQ